MSVVEVEHLVKCYGGVSVVDGISFEVERGEIFGIVGPNGAGKTTTVESIGGLRQPDSGTIKVLGLDPVTDRAELTQRVGAQLQESRLQDRIRVGEALDLYASFYRDPADWRELVDQLGLGAKVDSRYSDLSGGQKQRLSVALALVGSPEIAILDELTTGLDPAARRSTWEVIEQIREGGVTVLLVTHFMEEVERLCDRVMVVTRGRIAAVGTPSGLVRSHSAELRLRFRTSSPVDHEALLELSEVDDVTPAGRELVVTGSGNLVQAVTSFMAANEIVAEEFRTEQATLEDAYLELTGDTQLPDGGSRQD